LINIVDMNKNMLKLKKKYQEEVISAMEKDFDYDNPMAVPRIKKVVVSTSFGSQVENWSKPDEIRKEIEEDLAVITGQKPVLRQAQQSVAEFHVRQGDPVGFKVTLRGNRMYDFLERLIYLALPRSKDFKGIEPGSLDQQGNLNIGFEDQSVFPEIATDQERIFFGVQITVVTSTHNHDESLSLLKKIGFPFKEK